MSTYPKLRPDLQQTEASSSQETPNYLYLCVLERENARPFEFDFTLATGNALDIGSLTRHDLVGIYRCVAAEESVQIGLCYHQSRLRHSSQKVLTMIQIAKVKNQAMLCEILRLCQPAVDILHVANWYLRVLNTLVRENETLRILDISWDFSLAWLDDAAQRFTRASILEGKIVEGLGNELADSAQIPVFDMASCWK
ncbi:hypothetical protein BELL_0186g00040 [Botrytis elliptica]|uniref:Uncharacterized protein n=1 Tax=Botrytis elliptica TaxID=278938 RepID=A0A4Z1K3D0_9HELO|nr:hypothetical protein EAE99_000790 [Botrytis elliptica]TGO75893.1 hypothetical protein BELL_0186g00040 [Botrytis elliptica]